MIKIDPFLLIIFAEVVVGLVVILGAVTVVFIKRKNKDKLVLKVLQARMKDDTSKRESVLEESIAISCGDGEDNEAAVAENKEIAKKMAETESAFYSRLVTMYTQRDSTALKSLDKLLHEYTSSHLESVSQMRERIDAEQENISEELGRQMEVLEQNGQTLALEVEKLKVENKNLSGDLEKAHAEIDMAMQEYTRMAVTGSVGNKSIAAKKSLEPVKKEVEPVLEKEIKVDSAVDDLVDELEADPAALEKTGNADAIESESDLIAELDAELDAELETDLESVDELDGEDADVLVDMSMLDDFGGVAEPETVEVPDKMVEAVEPKAVEIQNEVIETVEPEAVEIPDEAIEPEAIEIPDKVLEAIEPETVEIPGEVIEAVEPEAVDIPDEVIEAVEPEVVEIADEVIEAVEPEVVDAPVKVANKAAIEEESLEDLVLHAMAEESAAQKAEAVTDEAPASMIIDLAKDDEIVLSDLNEVSAEPNSILERAVDAADEGGIDEDNLLAQLAEIENNDDFDSLDGFGDPPGSDEAKKPVG